MKKINLQGKTAEHATVWIIRKVHPLFSQFNYLFVARDPFLFLRPYLCSFPFLLSLSYLSLRHATSATVIPLCFSTLATLIEPRDTPFVSTPFLNRELLPFPSWAVNTTIMVNVTNLYFSDKFIWFIMAHKSFLFCYKFFSIFAITPNFFGTSVFITQSFFFFFPYFVSLFNINSFFNAVF